jgi:DNA replication protein DnaC
MESLKTKLRQLKLAGMVKSIDTRNKYAIDNKVSYIDFIELLIEDEYVNRKANSFGKRLNKSKINTQKGIDDFDFNYQPKLNKQQIMDLASCRFINENKNIVFMGKPGVGKTHLANAIGLEVLKQGYKVLCC